MVKDTDTTPERQFSEETREKIKAIVAEEIAPLYRQVDELHKRLNRLETPDSGEVERLKGEVQRLTG